METGFCLCLQMEPTQFGLIDRASVCTPADSMCVKFVGRTEHVYALTMLAVVDASRNILHTL
jgi:hypothetical protein